MKLNKHILKGIKILDLSSLYPGPLCSMLLADYGAEVVMLGRPDKEDLFSIIPTVCRGKKHITLDLKTEKGLSKFKELIKKQDVLLEGFRPGVMAKLGLSYEDLAQINPDLIYCSLSAYGQASQESKYVGHDLNILAKTAVLDLLKDHENKNLILPGVQIADTLAGVHAAFLILMALFQRERTGQASYIDVSLSESASLLLALPLFFKQLGAMQNDLSNYMLNGRYACYHIYKTQDQRSLAVGALEPHFWEQLCLYFNKKEYIALQFNESQREEIKSYFRAEFLKQDSIYWVKNLEKLNICVDLVKTIDEVFESVESTDYLHSSLKSSVRVPKFAEHNNEF